MLAALALTLCARADARTAAEPSTTPGYDVKPAPTWVVPAREAAGGRLEESAMHYRIIDEQVRVEGASAATYSHVVRVVDTTAGLATASQVELEFDPSYQTLTLHHFAVVRDGRRIDKLDRGRIRLLQRETQLDRQIYDGRVTASIVLDDVRVNDQIDFAYTIRGANPVFGGKFHQYAWMASQRGPVAAYQVRLLAPAERTIRAQVGGADIAAQPPSMLTSGGARWRESVFRRESVAQLRADPGAPASVGNAHVVRFSEMADWGEVARWGETLFAQKTDGALIDAKVRELRALSSDRAAQTLAALDFVQKDIRYFGAEFGVGSHRPAGPQKVMEQRSGDCKDKVMLLVALLNRLDIEARPLLVSTAMRSHVADLQPSPLAFDHVIARVTLDGKTYDLDATRGQQTGTLESRRSVGFGRGLLLAPDTTALSALAPADDVERIRVVDTVRIHSLAGEAVLESRATYRNDWAELTRASIAARGLAETATGLTGAYARLYPRLRSLGPVEVEAVDGDDAITLVQRYALPGFWRFPEQKQLVADFALWSILEALAAPKSETRRDPLNIAFPGVYRHRFAIEFDDELFTKPSQERYADGDRNFAVSLVAEVGPRSASSEAELRLRSEEIAAADWSSYSAKLGKLTPRLGASTISVSTLSTAQAEALSKRIAGIETDLRAGKLKAVTRVQVEAHYRVALYSAQLDGGRLAPELKAQTLSARGVQYDNLGRADQAEADFDAALALAGESNEIRNDAAVNAVQLRRYERAIELANQVLAQRPDDGAALNTRALARYLARDVSAAQADWNTLLKDRAQVRRGYPIVWLSMAARQGGQGITALGAAYPTDQLSNDWPRPIVDMALGRNTPDDLIKVARQTKTPRESLTEAYFYIAEKYYSEGDAQRASEYWRMSTEQGVVEFVENSTARARLAGVSAK